MDFSLKTLSDSFRLTDFRWRQRRFTSYAFILATLADRGIFPSLLNHYRELDELTGDYILVISPAISMKSAPKQTMDSREVMEVLDSGVFYNHYGRSYEDVGDRVRVFMERQTSEALKFARYCGISVKRIPCVVFFSSLEDPERYLVWELKARDSWEIVREFREVVAALEEEYRAIVDVNQQIRECKSEIAARRYAIDSERRRREEVVEQEKRTARKLKIRLVKWKRKLAEAQGAQTSDDASNQLQWLRSKREAATRALEKTEARLVQAEQDVITAPRARSEEAESKERELKSRISVYERVKSEIPVADPLQIIRSLDKKRFRMQIVKDLGRSIPLLNLGLSSAKLFAGE